MTVTRFGLQISSFTFESLSDQDLFSRIAEIAKVAEDSGFDSIWAMDHFHQIAQVGPRTDPMLEAYTLLGGIAARTEKASLGTMVTGVTYRNPALLAKQVSTLDIVSSGRAILGIGAAWNEEEHVGYGFDFPPIRDRMERLEEALRICKAMFTEDAPSFEGKHYRVAGALNVPKPVRHGGIPILVGGGGERKTLALVAKYADACNLFGDVATVRHKLDVLERHCERLGRDPATITKTRLGSLLIDESEQVAAGKAAEIAKAKGMDEERARSYMIAGDPDSVARQVAEYLDAGLDGLVFNMPEVERLDSVRLAGQTFAKAFAA